MRAWIVAVSVVAGLAVFWPARSHACSCSFGRVISTPANSAGGVPRNQAIVLSGNLQPDSLVLETLDGEPHGFELRAWQAVGPCGGAYSIEMVPTPMLAPDTHYEIRAEPSDGWGYAQQPVAIRFSTGTEVLPDPALTAPTGQVALFGTPSGVTSSCGDFVGRACLTVDDPTDVEVVLRDGDQILNEIKLTERNTSFYLWAMPTCIDLQRRAPTGRRSRPVSFCGDDLELLSAGAMRASQCGDVSTPTAPPSDDAESRDDPPASDDPSATPAEPRAEHRAYSCSARPGSRGGWFWFGVLGLLGLGRRRARARIASSAAPDR